MIEKNVYLRTVFDSIGDPLNDRTHPVGTGHSFDQFGKTKNFLLKNSVSVLDSIEEEN